MPQKRNPYALSIIRGASGVLIGRLSGFLAVTKSPSARSDNLIYAYGEVPRALDLTLRILRLATGVVRTLRVNTGRLAEEVRGGYTQATDLAEYLVQTCDVDYRTAYVIVGRTVRAASRAGVPGVAITGEMIDEAAVEHRGAPLGMAGRDLSAVLDPWQIVLSRGARGGASPEALGRMTTALHADLTALATAAAGRLAGYEAAEGALLETARQDAATPAPHRPARPHRPWRSSVSTVETALPPVVLPDAVEVVNVGLPMFADAVRAQGRPVEQVDWRPPAGGHPEAIRALTRLHAGAAPRSTRPTPRSCAGSTPACRSSSGSPRPARSSPASRDGCSCTAGRRSGGTGSPTRCAVRCARRRSPRGGRPTSTEADGLLASGAVRLAPANLHDTVVPMASAIGPSAPVLVVEIDTPDGTVRTFAPINQGPGEAPWFGRDTPAAVERLLLLRDVAGPAVAAVLERTGPLDVLAVAAQGIAMGDDLHMRTQAATNLLARTWLPHIAALPDHLRERFATLPRRQPPVLPHPRRWRRPGR